MEITIFELEQLCADRIDKKFWEILENNGMLRIRTKRDRDAFVQKAPRHPGRYLVTVA